MATGTHGLPKKAQVFLGIMQCTTEGVLATLLAMFLASQSHRRHWFKAYVVCVNILAVGQTAVHLAQTFNVINAHPMPTSLVSAGPILTGVIGASVQAFFIQRCWRIYHQKIFPMIPLLFLWLTSWASAVAIGGFGMQISGWGYNNALKGMKLSSEIWVLSSFILDLITTSSVLVYLYRVRNGLSFHQGAFVMAWQIVWTSATPPLVLMAISIIDGYMIPGSSKVIGKVSAALTGKFLVLSLMINLVGQKYIREQFERNRSLPLPPSDPRSFLSQNNQANEPRVIQIAVHTVEIELPERVNSRDPELDDSNDNHLEKILPT